MIALVFPGQGSQRVGMLADLAGEFPVVRDTFDVVSEPCGIDLFELATRGPEDVLDQTVYTQPAMLAAGVATWRIWQEVGGPQPTVLAGHSLGEYSALVAADALDLPDAARIVASRARAMQAAVPDGRGAMAAILKLDDATVAAICEAVDGIVEPANYNSPGQVVIAGEASAVERAVAAAEAAGARTVTLKVSVPAHCSLMQAAADEVSQVLAAVPLRSPRIPVIHNVDVAHHASDSAIRRALVDQLHRPVRWTDTVRTFIAQGVCRIGECGPGKVLSGLIRRVDKSLDARHVGDVLGLRQTIAAWS